MTRDRVALACVVLSLGALGVASSHAGSPKPFAPFPMIVLVPQFWSLVATHEARSLRWVTEFAVPAVIGPALFLLWNPGLLFRASTYPRRSTFGLACLSLLSVAWFWAGWPLGVKYEGQRHVVTVLLLNALALACAWAMALLARRQPSAERNLMGHAVVVGWLVWLAFPWLGELP